MPTQTRAGRRLLGDSACGDCMRRSVALLCYNPELMILQLRNARSGAHVAIATGRSSTAHFFSFCGIPLPRSLARSSLGLCCNVPATRCAFRRGPVGQGVENKFVLLPRRLNGSGSWESPDRGGAGQGRGIFLFRNQMAPKRQ